MIEIVKEPEILSFAENAVCYEFFVNDLADPGSPPYFSFLSSDFNNVQEGDSFTISFMYQGVSYSETFVFTATPDSSGQQIDINAPFPDSLLVNPVINDFFTFINNGSFYIFQFLDRDIINLQVSSADFGIIGIEGIPQSYFGYEIIADLFFETLPYSGVYEKKVRLCKCPQAEEKNSLFGRAVFNLKKYLAACLHKEHSCKPQLFHQTTTWVTPALKYYIQYRKRIDDKDQMVFTSDARYTILGGLDNAHAAQSSAFFGLNKNILSWLPNKRYVTCVQHNYLTFLNTDENVTAINVVLDIAYHIVPNTQTFTIHSGLPIAFGDKIHLPVGYSQLDLDQYGTAVPVKSYTITFTDDNGNPLGDPITFCLQDHHCSYKYFIYENSLGGFDSIFTTGPSADSLEIEKETAEIPQSCTYNTCQGSSFNYDTSSQEKTETSSGFHKTDCEVVFEELLLSRCVSEVLLCDCGCCTCPDPTKGYYKPINIEKSTVTIKEKNKRYNSVDFSYTEAWKDKKYTPILCELLPQNCNDEEIECPKITPQFSVELSEDGSLCVSLDNADVFDSASATSLDGEVDGTNVCFQLGICFIFNGDPTNTGINPLGANLASWNSKFQNGTPYTGLVVDGNTILLMGGSDLSIRANAFNRYQDARWLNLVAVDDKVGSVSNMLNYSFRGAGIQFVNFPGIVDLTRHRNFQQCVSLQQVDMLNLETIIGHWNWYLCIALQQFNAPKLEGVFGTGNWRRCDTLPEFIAPLLRNVSGSQNWRQCFGMTKFDFRELDDLGLTTNNNSNFLQITGQTILVILEAGGTFDPAANGGNQPEQVDNEFLYLVSNNTVTYQFL